MYKLNPATQIFSGTSKLVNYIWHPHSTGLLFIVLVSCDVKLRQVLCIFEIDNIPNSRLALIAYNSVVVRYPGVKSCITGLSKI